MASPKAIPESKFSDYSVLLYMFPSVVSLPSFTDNANKTDDNRKGNRSVLLKRTLRSKNGAGSTANTIEAINATRNYVRSLLRNFKYKNCIKNTARIPTTARGT